MSTANRVRSTDGSSDFTKHERQTFVILKLQRFTRNSEFGIESELEENLLQWNYLFLNIFWT